MLCKCVFSDRVSPGSPNTWSQVARRWAKPFPWLTPSAVNQQFISRNRRLGKAQGFPSLAKRAARRGILQCFSLHIGQNHLASGDKWIAHDYAKMGQVRYLRSQSWCWQGKARRHFAYVRPVFGRLTGESLFACEEAEARPAVTNLDGWFWPVPLLFMRHEWNKCFRVTCFPKYLNYSSQASCHPMWGKEVDGAAFRGDLERTGPSGWRCFGGWRCRPSRLDSQLSKRHPINVRLAFCMCGCITCWLEEWNMQQVVRALERHEA